MSRARHHIYQAVFDIDFYSKEKNHELQEKISRLFNRQIANAIDELLSEYDPGDHTIRLEQLTLDTGSLLFDHVESELPARIVQALRHQLDRLDLKAGGTHTSSSYKVISAAASGLESIEHYLRTGTFRWQDHHVYNNPEDLFAELLQTRPADLLELLKKLGRNEHTRRRIAYQFSSEAIAGIIRLVEPAHARLIIDYMQGLEPVQQQVVKTEKIELKKATAYFVLTYLLVERGSRFNTRSFVRSLVKQMSAHYNTGYQELLLVLRQQAPSYLPASQRYSLPQVIQEIFVEDYTVTPVKETGIPAVDVAKTAGEDANAGLELPEAYLYYFLEKGYLPATVSFFSQQQLQSRLLQLITQRAPSLREFIQQANPVSLARNISRHFQPQAHALLRQLSTLPDQWISETRSVLLRIHGQAPFIALKGTQTAVRKIEEAIMYAALFSVRGHADQKTFMQLVLQYLHPAQWQNNRFKIKQALDREGLAAFSELIDTGTSANKASEPVPGDQALPGQDITTGSNTSTKDKRFEMLVHFLQYGKMPWWSHSGSRQEALAAWNKLIALKNQQLIRFMKAHISEQAVRKNILLLMGNDILLHREWPADRKEENTLQQDDWLIIKNKLNYTAYHALTEAYLLYSFLGKDTSREILWQQVEKIFMSHRVSRQAIYADLLQLRSLIPGLHTNMFFSMLHTSMAEKTGLGTQQATIRQTGREQDTWNDDKNPRTGKRFAGSPGADEEDKQTNEKKDPRQNDEVFHAEKKRLEAGAGAGDESLQAGQLQGAGKDDQILRSEEPFDAGDDAVDTTTHATDDPALAMDLESLLEYLQTGYVKLPAGTDAAALVNRITESLSLNKTTPALRELYAILKTPGARKRLLDTLQDHETENLLRQLFRSRFQWLEDSLHDLKSVFAIERIKTQVGISNTRLLEQTMLYLAGQRHGRVSVAEYVRFMMAHLFERHRDYVQFSSLLKISLFKKEVQVRTFLPALALDAARPEKKKPAATPKEKDAGKKPELVFIDNAGLVILWPFFGFYFQSLELIKENKFVSKDAASRAAYLLQYLATGLEEAHEHAMPLNKLLCHIPRARPLAAPITLSEQERTLSDELLTVAISRWEALKNTSIAGFRNSFLLRKGKLEWAEETVTLTVEPASYDMLIDKIPWTISTIKLPWLETPLHVKWR